MSDLTDPAALTFAACAGFSGLFLLVSVLSGALHGHGTHHQPTHHVPGDHALHAVTHQTAPTAAPAGHAPNGHTAHQPAPSHAVKHIQHLHHGHASHHGHHAHRAHHSAAHTHLADHAQNSQAHGHGTTGHQSRIQTSARVVGYLRGLTTLLVQSLNLYAILTFLFYFGVIGYLLQTFVHPGSVRVFLIATVLGMAAALAFTAAINHLFGDTSGLLTRENSGLSGREAKVIRPIREGGTGEVLHSALGGVAQSTPARSTDGHAIPVGQPVVIVDVKHGIALVQQLQPLSDLEGAEALESVQESSPPSQ